MDKNEANEGVISVAASRVAVRVIRTNEEQVIARLVGRILSLGVANNGKDSGQATKYRTRLAPFPAGGVPP